MKYKQICKLLAARRCFDAGQSVKDIATSAKKSTTTIRRWLRTTC